MFHTHAFHPRHPRPATAEKGIRCPDLLALVTFGDDARVQCRLSSAFDPVFAAKVIGLGKVEPGWTNIAAGMRAGTNLLAAAPRGLRKRMWVLSDGRATHQVERIMPEAKRARENWININTIGFGDPKRLVRRHGSRPRYT
jgi:Mg-chelatase subunit ChlD